MPSVISSQGSSSQSTSQSSRCSFRHSPEFEEQVKEMLNPVRDLSKNWDIDILVVLRRYLEDLEAESEFLVNGEVGGLNFAQAALILQGSTSVYAKKVEYVYYLTYQLVARLHNDVKKPGATKGSKDKDVMLAGRHNSDDFVALDDISYRPDVELLLEDLDTAVRRYCLLKITLTPLPLIPLDDHEKGDIILKTVKGEVIGNKRDFQMNVCHIDSSGCIYLPTLNFDFTLEEANISSNSFFSNEGGCNDNDSVADDDDVPADFNDILPMDVDDVDPVELNQENSADVNNNVDDLVLPSPVPNSPAKSTKTPSTKTPSSGGNTSQIGSDENELPSRRRSLRQAQAQKLAKEKLKKPEVNLWAVRDDEQTDLKMPLVRKTESKKPKSRKSTSRLKRTEDEVPQTIQNFVEDKNDDGAKAMDYAVVCPIDSKALKKLSLNAVTSVNAAFEQVASDCCRDEEEIIHKLRKKLVLRMNNPPDDGIGGLDGEGSDNEDMDDGPEPMPDGGSPCASPDSGCMLNNSPRDIAQCFASCEDMVEFDGMLQAHVDHYMKDTVKYSESTELSERVKAWEEKIRPVIEQENEREVFNIHLYGSRIIDKFQDNNRKQSLPFTSICQGKSRWEICRYFLASLILANNNNVEISAEDTPSGMHEVSLTLLSRKRHQENIDAFGHSFGEHGP